MSRKIMVGLAVMAVALSVAVSAPAEYIDFTGGTYTLVDGTTGVTNGSVVAQGVDYYEENGFKLDFVGPQNTSFESIIGDYYGAQNDVIHGHWATGDYGGMTEIRVTKLDGTAFDLNYFILTSNTDFGGGQASGAEMTYIHASKDGTNITYSQLLPPDDWGFSGTNPQIILGTQFDDIYWFSFTVANAVDCFGMDDFYIDEQPPGVPEPGTLVLLGSGLVGLALSRRRK